MFTFVIANFKIIMTTKEYSNYKQKNFSGRYITLKNIEPLLKDISNFFEVTELGESFLQKPIYKVKIGTGKKRILIWSQMHGNETTGTKAVFDLFNFLKAPKSQKKLRDQILEACTLIVIPMLNPDGAKKFTRVNAQEIDLNRDAVALKAPESILLNTILHDFRPHYCFNLHDQRPIFSVGVDSFPATISFLAPSIDAERTVTDKRKETMQVIVAMHKVLEARIPNQIGRYTDEFYPTATGDNFQKAGFNTILIEAGHYKGDYSREKTREYNFLALLSGIKEISMPKNYNYESYFKIPNNEKKYFDSIYENIILGGKRNKIGVFLKIILFNEKIKFVPIHKILNNFDSFNADVIISNCLKFKNIEEFKGYVSTKLVE